MTAKTCQARQYSDQMQCPHCGTAWDTNDPDPPPCRKDQPKARLSEPRKNFARRNNKQLRSPQ